MVESRVGFDRIMLAVRLTPYALRRARRVRTEMAE